MDAVACNAVFTHLTGDEIAADVVGAFAMDNRSDNWPCEPHNSTIKKLRSCARNDIDAVNNYVGSSKTSRISGMFWSAKNR